MNSAAVRAIVTDIEGTTSSLSFVQDVLFPYARARMADFVRDHGDEPEVRRLLDAVATVAGHPLDDDAAVAQLLRWIDEDRKVTPLKALQGLIWEGGFRSGHFTGHVYADAARRLRAWHARGLPLYVYSSGSVHAQKLLFGHSDHGDLTPLFAGYFDTTIGAKQDADSYRRVAAVIGLEPGSILFLSDVPAELDAAATAGFKTCWLVRDGAAEADSGHPVARNFDEVHA